MEGIAVEFSLYYHILQKSPWDAYETEFYLDGDAKYRHCWMGYLAESMDFRQGSWHKKIHEKPYWMGLTPDGNEGYDFYTADEMIHAPVFDGQSLEAVWPHVRIRSAAGMDGEEWLKEQKQKYEKEDGFGTYT